MSWMPRVLVSRTSNFAFFKAVKYSDPINYIVALIMPYEPSPGQKEAVRGATTLASLALVSLGMIVGVSIKGSLLAATSREVGALTER